MQFCASKQMKNLGWWKRLVGSHALIADIFAVETATRDIIITSAALDDYCRTNWQ